MVQRLIPHTLVLLLGLLWSGLLAAAVELPSGQYHLTHHEFSVKVPGGTIPVERTWYDGRWHFNSAWDSLAVSRDSLGKLSSVGHHGDTYREGSTVGTFTFGKRETIREADEGLRWEDRDGNWADYSAEGRLQRYGDSVGLTARFSYDDAGRPVGVFDRNDRQVLWYVYSGDDLVAIHDGGTPQRTVHYSYNERLLVSATDVRGKQWRYEYQAVSADSGTLTLTTSSGSSGGGGLAVGVDPNWRKVMTAHTDSLGRKTTIEYDKGWHASKVTYPDGRWREYTYDYNKTRKEYYTRTTYSDGRERERWYDDTSEITREVDSRNGGYEMVREGNTRTVTDARGLKTVKTYDEWDNLLSVTWPDGSRVRHTVEPTWSNITRSVDERGNVTTYEYDDKGQLIRLSEAVGSAAERITEYSYDAAGNQLSRKRLGDAATAEALTRYQDFDAGGSPQTIIDAEGNTHSLTYNLAGDITGYTAPNGGTWELAYNPAGQLTSLTDPLGHTTTYQYDAVGNLKSRTGPAPSSVLTLYDYDAGDRLTALTDALGGVLTLSYDSNSGRLKRLTDATDITRYRLGYDAGGNLASLTDAAGNTTAYDYGLGEGADYPGLLNAVHYPTYSEAYDYDKRDRVSTLTEQYGDASRARHYQYDAGGNLAQQTDAGGRTRQNQYDALGRLIQETDPAGGTTTYSYDDRDNLLSVTNARGVVIRRYSYDHLNRLTAEHWPDGRTQQTRYDDSAGTVSRIDAKGQVMRSHKDAAGRLVRIDYLASEGAATPVRTVSFSRDERGQLMQVSDGSLSLHYTYDALGRQLSETVDYGSFSLSYAYEYDAAGRKRTLVRPDGKKVSYGYDNAGQLASISVPEAGTLTWSGYQWNAPTRVTLPGGSARQWVYDALMRPTLIAGKDAGGNPLLQYQYHYDATDNITARQTEHGDYTYGYDTLDRLTTVDNPNLADEAYSYDAVGNRLTDAAQAGEWQYGEDDRLTERPGVTYQYDANGSLIEKNDNGAITRYTYDVAGRMTEVRDGSDSLIARYAYDPFGRRIKKTTSSGTTYFLYSDEGLIAEAEEGGAISRQYGWEPDGTWGTDPLTLTEHSNTYYYQNDHLGTPQKLITASGAVVWSAEYESFGQAHPNINTIANPLRFPGQYYDVETGTHYNYFRDYDPSIGRYVESDPIGLWGGENNYTYTDGSPIIYIDPLGWMRMYAYPTRGRGNGWESDFEFHFDPIYETAGKGLVKRYIKKIAKKGAKYATKAREFWDEYIDVVPVGPRRPKKDRVPCGLLDVRLQKEYKGMFGDKKRLTREEAKKFLNYIYLKYPKVRKLYPRPDMMVRKAEKNMRDNWYYKYLYY